MYGFDPDATSQEIMARTLWGEARGEGDTGMEAVASVIINRIKSGITWWGHDITSVCTAPYQFSCWNKSDPNLPKLVEVTETDPAYASAFEIASRAINGDLSDSTGGATAYYNKRMQGPPKWANGLTPSAEIGHHLFFKV